MTGLSLTAGKRIIQDGSEFNRFFPVSPSYKDPIVRRDGEVEDSVKIMCQVAERYKGDTAVLAQYLRGSTIEETCNNIWNFIYTHIQYTEDKPGVEQIRTPLRTWYDRQAGVDCDCMSVFASSILRNLGIPHYFRITKYYHRPDYQHVYVIVPVTDGTVNGPGYYTIDGVIDGFNKEKSFTGAKDFNIMNGMAIQVLNGPGDEYQDFLYKYLQLTAQTIQAAPTKVKSMCAGAAGDLLRNILDNWNKGKNESEIAHNRIVAVQSAANIEETNFPGCFFFRSLNQHFYGDADPIDVHRNQVLNLNGLGDPSDEQYAGPRMEDGSYYSNQSGSSSSTGGSFDWSGLFNFLSTATQTIVPAVTGNKNDNQIIPVPQPQGNNASMGNNTVYWLLGFGVLAGAVLLVANANANKTKQVVRSPRSKTRKTKK